MTPPGALPQVVADELDRLDAREVILLGGEQAISTVVADQVRAGGRSVIRIGGRTRYDTAAAVARALPKFDGAFVASGTSTVDAVVAGAAAAARGWPVLLVPSNSVSQATADLLVEVRPPQLVVVGGQAVIDAGVQSALAASVTGDVIRIGGADRYRTAVAVHRFAAEGGDFSPAALWLAAGEDDHLVDALSAGPAVVARQASLLLVDGRYLEAVDAVTERLRELGGQLRSVTLVGGSRAVNGQAAAQLDALLHGPELPGGGRSLLPQRRLVALYGSHFSPALGVLGEQPPAQLGPRLEGIVAPYRDLSDRPVLPALDLIATVATGDPGPDGLHRARSDDSQIQQWLDAARANGAYLVLDLQPGRSDFLTEAKVYERFLREPDVGLALDPEWRTPAPARPGGGTIGSVTAAEINAVSAWLADLVVEEQLPEKLLVVHNFRVDMVSDRDAVMAPPGVAVLFHMDGQGRRAVKLDSYRILTQTLPFYNGVKIFFDEDPDPFRPSEVLDLIPTPDFISYQ